MNRPDWKSYFLGIAEAVSKRADCKRRQVGAIVVDKTNHIISTGYNGTRPGYPGCLSGVCPRGQMSYDEVQEYTDYSNCIATHAEMNAILHSPISIQGLRVYVTDKPCPDCEKTLRNAGLSGVYWPGGCAEWFGGN